jgi:hypothetical protein
MKSSRMHCYDPPETLILLRICLRSHSYNYWIYIFIPGHPSKKEAMMAGITDLLKDILQNTW